MEVGGFNNRLSDSSGYGAVQNCQEVKKMPENSKQTASEGQSDNRKLSGEDTIKLIEEANKTLIGSNTEVEYSIHEKTHQIMIKIVNSETKEVVKEIPSEKILDLVAKFCEMAGLIVDEKV